MVKTSYKYKLIHFTSPQNVILLLNFVFNYLQDNEFFSQLHDPKWKYHTLEIMILLMMIKPLMMLMTP